MSIEKQKKALDITSELWKALMDIDKVDLHQDDTNDLRFHIHAIQNILYAQAYIKENGKL